MTTAVPLCQDVDGSFLSLDSPGPHTHVVFTREEAAAMEAVIAALHSELMDQRYTDEPELAMRKLRGVLVLVRR